MERENELKTKISFKLLKIIFSFFIITSVIVTSVQIYLKYTTSKQKLLQELKITQKIFEPSLAKAFWDMNPEQINSTFLGIAEYPNIVGVKIENEFEDFNVSQGMVKNKLGDILNYSDGKAIKVKRPVQLLDNTFDIVYEYRGEKRNLGTATVYSSMDQVFEEIKNDIISIILNTSITSIALLFIFSFFTNEILTKPLMKFTDIAKELNLENIESYHVDLGIKERNEIKILEEAFNKMLKNLVFSKEKIEEEIEERKKVEKALIVARDEAEKANLAKSQFLANMSHEIRTPMNGIIGLIQILLMMGMEDEKKKMYLEKMEQSADHLLRIINDILDISKIEAGKIELEEEEFLFDSFIESIVESFSVSAHGKNLELLLDIDESLSKNFIADTGKLKQILINLIGNSVKFTEKGEIYVGAKKIVEYEDAIDVEFVVRDTGIGISEDKLENIFKPFIQGDLSYTKKYQGTGLGLAISQNLAELMGGEISCVSEKNKGTSFFVKLSIKKSSNVNTNYELEEFKFSDLKILVVDDNKLNQEIVEKMLSNKGMEVELADSGHDALKFLKEKDYDLILLDVNMPEFNGFDTAEAMREIDKEKMPIIVMFTSVDIRDEISRIKAMGINSYIIKPVKRKDLLEIIRKSINKIAERRVDEYKNILSRPSDDMKSKRILLVEDNLTNRITTKEMLEMKGYRIIEAENGKRAIELLEYNKVDIVLMDIQMPVMNGMEAIKVIRENQKWRDLPVIALTAYAMKHDREKFLAAGMNEYISKPVRYNELVTKIEKFI